MAVSMEQGVFLVLLSICIQHSLSATTTPATSTQNDNATDGNSNTTTVAPSACPRYEVRYEDNALIFTYLPGECEMVVTMENATMEFPKLKKLLRKVNRKMQRKTRTIRKPLVTFRAVANADNSSGIVNNSCQELPTKSVGAFVFVQTVARKCRILLIVNNKKDLKAPLARLIAKRRNLKPRYDRLPAYEYVDDNLILKI